MDMKELHNIPGEKANHKKAYIICLSKQVCQNIHTIYGSNVYSLYVYTYSICVYILI